MSATRASGRRDGTGVEAFVTDCLVDQPVEGGQVVAQQWCQGLPLASLVVRRRPGAGGRALLLPPRRLWALRRQGVRQVDLLFHSGLTHALLLNALLTRWLCGGDVTLIVLQRHRSVGVVAARLLRGHTTVVVAHAQDRAYFEACGLRTRQLDPIASPDRVSGVSREEARRVLGLPQDAVVFLHVGHGTPGRNLHALAPLASGGTLVLVLSPYSALDPEAVPSGDDVVVIHERVDVASYYRAADVYVFPTTDGHSSISVPMSVVEASAGGLPVVARRSALTERWADHPGVDLVDDDEGLVSVARARAGAS